MNYMVIALDTTCLLCPVNPCKLLLNMQSYSHTINYSLLELHSVNRFKKKLASMHNFKYI